MWWSSHTTPLDVACVPRLLVARPHRHGPHAERAAGTRSIDPDTCRGNYCPKEHQQHLELAANQSKVAVAYTQIVTIATDDHHTLQEFRASVGAQWTFLSDPDRTIQRDLDIQEYTTPSTTQWSRTRSC